MDFNVSNDNESDDEIFFGKLTLKEVKKRIMFDKPIILPYQIKEEVKCDTSLKIIEIHSEPDINSMKKMVASPNLKSNSNPNFSPTVSDTWAEEPTEDSFLKLEKMVTELHMSPKNEKTDNLDNTLEVVEYILNNAPTNRSQSTNSNEHENFQLNEHKYSEYNTAQGTQTSQDINKNKNENQTDEQETYVKIEDTLIAQSSNICCFTPQKCFGAKSVSNSCQKNTTKIEKSQLVAKNELTPLIKHSDIIFKTPKNFPSSKKPAVSSTKKTPSKINSYQHITSPVAFYIKNSPQVPLLRDVHPKKPLVGSSSIPKLLKNPADTKVNNKENIVLPSLAYRSAKKTQMISVPDKEKLPQSQWAKKLTSSLPKPVVIKHDHRQLNSLKKTSKSEQEDSFNDLTLHQAELSICTQKSAFNKVG